MRYLLLLTLLFPFPGATNAQTNPSASPPTQTPDKVASGKPVRASLSPRFSPGQSYVYQMQFQNSTSSSRSGLAADPQGPSKLTIVWGTTIRLDVLPGEPTARGTFRLRISYDKSSADVQSDSFDPEAAPLQEQYANLTGKQIEFTLDAKGDVLAVKGLEDVVQGDAALETARKWIAQIASGPGAPAGGVIVGQKWSSDQPADSLPISGLVWRMDSQYLRNEACHPASSAAVSISTAVPAVAVPSASATRETCAVILSTLALVNPKSGKNSTPESYRQNGMRTTGKWNGNGQSLSYVSLKTGLVVSLTQTANEAMDVTFTTEHLDSLRYSGTVASQSQVSLVNSTPAL